MNWRIDFSTNSLKFLKQNNLEEFFIIEKIKLALRKFKGEIININIKKLRGEWERYYRIRSGRLRIIIEFQFEQNRVYVAEIDWRGNIYK
jgi:mRNA interferase RelE/StbE